MVSRVSSTLVVHFLPSTPVNFLWVVPWGRHFPSWWKLLQFLTHSVEKFGLIQEKDNLPSCTWCSTSLQSVNTIIVPKLPQLKPSVDVTQKWWDENDSLCPVQCGVLRFLGWEVRSAYTVIKAPSLGVTVAMPKVAQAKSGLFLRKCYHKS